MSRSLAKSGKAVAIKSLKEKWEKSVQSAKVNGEKEIGGSSTITENRKIAETTALINSGATICCINLHLAQRMKWPLEKLHQPM